MATVGPREAREARAGLGTRGDETTRGARSAFEAKDIERGTMRARTSDEEVGVPTTLSDRKFLERRRQMT